MNNTELKLEKFFKRNIMVIAETEAALQGIIRAIEALDSEEKNFGIIHGATRKEMEEVDVILADLAQALVITTENVLRVDQLPSSTPSVTPKREIDYFILRLPLSLLETRSYDEVKDWLTNPENGFSLDLLKEFIKD